VPREDLWTAQCNGLARVTVHRVTIPCASARERARAASLSRLAGPRNLADDDPTRTTTALGDPGIDRISRT